VEAAGSKNGTEALPRQIVPTCLSLVRLSICIVNMCSNFHAQLSGKNAQM
jgi:hypothetical protein